jgi:hypothetical protein
MLLEHVSTIVCHVLSATFFQITSSGLLQFKKKKQKNRKPKQQRGK